MLNCPRKRVFFLSLPKEKNNLAFEGTKSERGKEMSDNDLNLLLFLFLWREQGRPYHFNFIPFLFSHFSKGNACQEDTISLSNPLHKENRTRPKENQKYYSPLNNRKSDWRCFCVLDSSFKWFWLSCLFKRSWLSSQGKKA